MPTIREIVKGAFTRFLPVSLAELVVIMILFDKGFGLATDLGQYPVLLWAGGMTAGHLVTMLLLRPRLRNDSYPAGRKTVVSGFCAALALAAIGLMANGLTSIGEAALAMLSGAAASVAIYFPWIRTTERDVSLPSASASPPVLAAPDARPTLDSVLHGQEQHEPRGQR